MEPPQIAELIIVILASIGLFVLASYEATFTSLSKSSLERMHESGLRRARRMLRIYEPRQRLHTMARVGQALGAIVLVLALSLSLQNLVPSPVAAAASAACISTIVVLLAGLVRRVRFEEDGEETRIPAYTNTYIPLHLLLRPAAILVERLSRNDSDEEFKEAREEELRSMVDAEQETGVLEETERDMIQGVFGFHDRVVREVMVPRVDITALEQSGSLADLLHVIEEKGHSRVPLYDESLDRIRGVVYAKDLLHMLVRRKIDLAAPVADLISEAAREPGSAPFAHEPYYVPETKKIDELLRDLRVARTRLAIVVDEYGGTAGLVTTEDLIEEIVGELQDEYDAEEELFEWRQPHEILVVNPRINIVELNELLETDLPSDGFDTLGGFIYDHLGEVPAEGQTVQIPGLDIEVLKIEGQRIAQVQMTRVPLLEDVDGEADVAEQGS